MRFIFYYIISRWFFDIILKAQTDPIETLFVNIEGDFSGLLDAADEGVDKTKGKLEELDGAAQKGGGSMKKGAAIAGAAFGLAATAASALLNVVISLATSAVQLFQNLSRQAIQLASDFEQAQLTFTNIFKDEAQANKFLADLRGEATRLGISFNDAAQFAKSIFPDTKNAEEFNRILKNAAIGAADAGLPLRELIFSFNEAVAGDFTSIRDRLDIPREVIERIKAAPDRVAAINEELEKLFEKRGVDNLEAMSSTFEGLKRQVAGFGEGLLGLAGTKILEPLREILQKIVDIIKEYGPSLDHVAEQFGEIIAMVINFGREEAVDKVFDATLVFRMVESLKLGVEWLKSTVEGFLNALRAAKAFGVEIGKFALLYVPVLKLIFGTIVQLVANTTVLGLAIQKVSERVQAAGGFFAALKEALVAGAQGFAIVNAVIAGLKVTVLGALDTVIALGKALFFLATANLEGFKNALLDANTGIKQVTEGGAAAFKDSMLESAKAIDQATSPAVKDLTDDVKGLDKAMDDAADTAEAKPLLDPDQVEKFGDQLTEAVENRAKQQAELEEATAEKINKIVADANKKRLSIDKKFDEARADLAKDSEKKRLKVINDTSQELAKLEETTDKQLASRRSEFNKDELRETEDHLKAMRRLEEDFLFNLTDAVRDRDARAIVDLQRQFQRESSRREEDFSTNQNRKEKDFDTELDSIRQNEANRREELLAAQAQELDNINKFEEEKRADIEMRRQEEQEKLEQDLAEKIQRENDNFIRRQAALDEALQKQLESVAKNLADQKDVTEEGAREILETFDKFFGIGGDIDQLMEDFARKRKIRADITVAFSGKTAPEPEQSTPGPQPRSGRPRLGGVQEFATGGTGEAGPEVVQFTPMSELGSPGQSEPGRMIVELTGSAPPGIGAGERDQIAAVLLNALRDTGALA
jgi:hypothetical protein